MAQKLRDDKIGTLQHSAGNIQMLASLSSPAYLTIGGQQYKITSTLVVTLPAMSANTRYQVFAVQSGGVVSLVISQNENSVGPAGYTRWKLVGSLYSNGMSPVAFGSFIKDLKGTPMTDEWRVDNTFNLTGFGTTTQVNVQVWRVGGRAVGRFHFKAGTVTAADARFNITNALVDSLRVMTDGAFARRSSLGQAVGSNSSSTGVFAPSELQFALYHNNTYPTEVSITDGFASSGGDGFMRQVGGDTVLGNNASMQGNFEFPVSGWSNTPIEDL